jgi:hypothetical protein
VQRFAAASIDNLEIFVGGEPFQPQERSMFRKISWIPLWALLLGLGAPADAQQPIKISRVGYLAAVSAAADAPRLKAFR